MEQATAGGAPEVELLDRAEIKDGQAVVTYSRTEAAVAELRKKYQGARYDLTTTSGDKAARAARLELVTVRTSLEKKRKELKAPAVEFGNRVDGEAARLTQEILALEAPIDSQIKTDEQRREAERRAKEEAEAARKKRHTDAIARIAGYVAQAAGLPSDRLAKGVQMLETFDLTGFEEFTVDATATRDATLQALRELHAKTVAREQEDARLKAEREEQACVAAAQAQREQELRAQQAELDRQRAELERQQQEREAAERRQREEAEAAQRRQQQAAAQGTPSEPAQPPTVVLMPTRAAASAPSGRIALGAINRRLAPIQIDTAGLAAIGFTPDATEANSKLYDRAKLPAICDALIARLVAVRDGQQEAA